VLWPLSRLQQQEVVEALKAVAGSINTFKNDGSFMQQMMGQQQQQQQQPGEPSGPRSEGRQSAEPSSMEEDERGQQQQQRRRQGSSSGDEQARDVAEPAAAAAAAAQQHVAAPASGSNRATADLLRARLGGASKGPAAAPPPAAAAAGGAGNRSAAEALRARLAGKPVPAAAAAEPAGAGKQREVVVLPQVDARGRAMPGAFGRESAGDGLRAAEAAAGGRMNKRVQRYGADGTRERYFADDDSVDLQVRAALCFVVFVFVFMLLVCGPYCWWLFDCSCRRADMFLYPTSSGAALLLPTVHLGLNIHILGPELSHCNATYSICLPALHSTDAGEACQARR
jgi:hypothetical protein